MSEVKIDGFVKKLHFINPARVFIRNESIVSKLEFRVPRLNQNINLVISGEEYFILLNFVKNPNLYGNRIDISSANKSEMDETSIIVSYWQGNIIIYSSEMDQYKSFGFSINDIRNLLN